jgi:hypothetical protein
MTQLIQPAGLRRLMLGIDVKSPLITRYLKNGRGVPYYLEVFVSYTTDPNDPRLTRGIDQNPVKQAEVYIVLSEEERSKGFIRPVRDTYRHVGEKPKYPLRDLTPEEKEQHGAYGYVKYEPYPESESPLAGMYWTRDRLNSGCGGVTTMGRQLAETYARDPKFYGATYCVRCGKHRPVAEFVWDDDGEKVGS